MPSARDHPNRQLLERYRRRDPRAERELAPRVIAIAKSVTRGIDNPSDREEAIQHIAAEILLALRRTRLDHPAALESWIRRVARRKLTEIWRELAGRRAEILLSEVPDERSTRAEDESVERLLDLIPAIRRLSSVQRQVIGYRFVRDWAVKDIAEVMGRRERTVYVDIHRALRRLRNDPGVQALVERNL